MSQAVSIQSCLQNGNIMGALKHAEMWVIQENENAEAWFWRGTVQAAGRLEEEAVKSWQQALLLMPTHRGASHNLTLTLLKSGQLIEARDHLLKTESLLPEDGQIQVWLGHVWSALSEPEKALNAYKKSLQISGRDPQILKLAAMSARDIGQAEEGLSLIDQALDIQKNNPDLLFERAYLNLTLGHFKEGFKDYESRWQRDSMSLPDLPMPLWQGEDLSGKHLLVHDEQGIGDSIMFARFLNSLTTKAASVSYWVRPHLKRLLSSLGEQIQVITDADNKADYHCPVMSLPYLMGLSQAENLSITGPYLKAEADLLAMWKNKLSFADGKKKIGLIWQGDPSSQAERGRSQSFAAYLPYLKAENHYFILQCQHGREELSGLILPENVTDLGMELDQGKDAFIDTAAVMSLIDQIITTDTGPAHLAGALAIPTDLILKAIPEWRWGNTGDKSIWYPSMTLHRNQIAAAFN